MSAKTSSESLKKVKTSNDQARRRHNVWKKTSNVWRFEDVRFRSSWRRPIFDVLKTSHLRSLEDVWFTTFWNHPIYIVLKTSNLRRLEDSVKRRLCSKVVATSMKRRKKWFFLILYGLKYSQNFICLGMTFCKLLWYFKSFMTEVSFKGLVSIW